MIIQSSSCPADKKRIFYGIKQNGRAYFNNDSTMNILTAQASASAGMFESEGIVIKSSDTQKNGKEHSLSIGKLRELCRNI